MLALPAKLRPIMLELVMLFKLEMLAIGATTETAWVSALARHPLLFAMAFLLVYASIHSNSLWFPS